MPKTCSNNDAAIKLSVARLEPVFWCKSLDESSIYSHGVQKSDYKVILVLIVIIQVVDRLQVRKRRRSQILDNRIMRGWKDVRLWTL